MDCIIHLTYDEFRRQFLDSPNPTSRTKRRSPNVFKALENADNMSANALSDAFINAVNTHQLIPGSTMTCYPRETEPENENMKHKLDVAIFQASSSREHGPFSCADQTIPVVFVQPAFGADPFYVSASRYPDEEDNVREMALKRISTTVKLLFAVQHRVAIFILLVIGRQFRFVRWDRAGLIVTPAIDYFDDPATLCDLLGCVSRLDPAALGFDPTATRILPGTAEFLQMDCAAQKNWRDVDHTARDLDAGELEAPFVFGYARTLFRESLAVDAPRYRLEVSSGAGAATRYYLVGKPTFIAEGFIGRGTRGYVSLDCQTRRFVWLKDTWRMSYLGRDLEGDILHCLNVAGVEGVPTLVCHGDVLEQATVTSGFPYSSSKVLYENQVNFDAMIRGPLPQHTHYRIVVEEVCLPLDNFTNGRQLVSLVLDALRTHCRVANDPQTRLLHCDISSGNIMICPKIKYGGAGGNTSLAWTSILSDWELAKSMDSEQSTNSNADPHYPLGTYQFTSINQLQFPSRPAQIADELESFFHVIVYFAVRHLQSTCDHPSWWIADYFYRYYHEDRAGRRASAIQFHGHLENGSPPGFLFFFSPLDELLYIALQSFKAHYDVRNYDRQRPRTPPTARLPKAPTQLNSAQRRILSTDYHVDEKIVAPLRDGAAALEIIDRGPTAEHRAQAALLVDHKWMLAHLEEYLQDPRWTDNDRIPPSQPSPSVPGGAQPSLNANAAVAEARGKRLHPAQASGGVDRAAKRQQTSKSKSHRKALPLARPSTHEMRTRSQTRRERAHIGALVGRNVP